MCTECEQKNPIQKPLYMSERHVVRTIYQIFDKQCIRSSAHITRGSIMASDVRREVNEDGLRRRRERDRNRREKPVTKDAQGLLNSFNLCELEPATCLYII